MLVANAFEYDTRVYKQARSLVARGDRVTVIAMAKPGLPVLDALDGINIRRITLRRGRALAGLAATLIAWPARRTLAGILKADPPLHQPEARRTRPGPAARLARAGGIVLLGVAGAAWLLAVGITALLAPLGARAAAAAGFLTRGVRSRLALLAFNYDAAALAAALSPDLVESHDLTALAGGVVAARAARCPLIYDSHELFLERNIGDSPRWPDKAWWGPIEGFGIRRSDAVLTVAEGIARHLERRYHIPRVHLVRNTQPFEQPPRERRLLRDEFGLAECECIALYPGAILRFRGLEQLINAAPMFRGVTAVIMGYAQSPEYLTELENRARENGTLGRAIRFKPAVPIDQVLRWVASADIVVVPTQAVCMSYRFEASNKIFHAVMAGVPLAMSDHEEKRILAVRHGIGVLFDETNPEAIAHAVNDLAHDEAARLAYGRACLAAARELSWERDVATYLDIVSRLTSPAAGARA